MRSFNFWMDIRSFPYMCWKKKKQSSLHCTALVPLSKKNWPCFVRLVLERLLWPSSDLLICLPIPSPLSNWLLFTVALHVLKWGNVIPLTLFFFPHLFGYSSFFYFPYELSNPLVYVYKTSRWDFLFQLH